MKSNSITTRLDAHVYNIPSLGVLAFSLFIPWAMAEEFDESKYKTIFDPKSLVKRGLCPVTQVRWSDKNPFESHSLYYELHGSGPEKVVFIMGYAASLLHD